MIQIESSIERYLWTDGSSGPASPQLADALKKHLRLSLLLKLPGDAASMHSLQLAEGDYLQAASELPLQILQRLQPHQGGGVELQLHIEAREKTYFHLQGRLEASGFSYEASDLLLPGFWYRKNLRSPENTPSARISTGWMVREDRLSSPLTGIFDRQQKSSYSLLRMDPIVEHALSPHSRGEVILSGPSDLGALGFGEEADVPHLSFSYPYCEAPHSYYRKLSLGAPTTAFRLLQKGEHIQLRYLILNLQAYDYADYMRQIWTRSYDLFQPREVSSNTLSDAEIKRVLSRFYHESYVSVGRLRGFSGVHLETATCSPGKLLEVGFVGRVLLNAFNALEWAREQGDAPLEEMAYSVMNSYEKWGFSKEGFIRELVGEFHGYPVPKGVYSIRRQSEGIYAILLYLDYEKQQGRHHPLWELRLLKLLDALLGLQQADGSFPRKFRGNGTLEDAVGGSSPSAVPALVMAYAYFGQVRYLRAARRVIDYQEKEIISKSDYFSSTLDADCEDKEASLYAVVALYYMALVSEGGEKIRYTSLARQAAYFTLSWYYTWDVPFAQGQMLGDLGLKSRGWGNVSVENNHIDVYVFEFDEVLKWLAQETGEHRFADFAKVIRSSMREQLLPYEGRMAGIAKEGYYPEVVQHTDWDYGHFGKGFYNDLFAPGWTVSSIWELLTDNRAANFLQRYL
ncbi:hypothetical protein [Cesiribacter andamanensis]|uniref:Uncharacterized protein n=1 Tax=Cesiribacter andamanensis AMV16 TaxID=1279009 RepID=M7N785_9BACT|nr:hypothetical protein [Cesiribacter andamanensis]EMR03132.1 hypothetical protein ADICEAN_01733 [Cesiribacter andamanensis AMV16]